jgi:hypothetical protein
VTRIVSPLIAGAALALAARRLYRLLAGGALTVDLDVGRRVRPLGPLVQTMRAPQDVVFEVIAAPYLGRTPRALADKLQVWERGGDMVLAAHLTPVKCGMTTTLETVRFQPPRADRLPARPRPGATPRGVVPAFSEPRRHRATLAGRARHRPLGARGMVGQQGRARLERRRPEIFARDRRRGRASGTSMKAARRGRCSSMARCPAVVPSRPR